MPTIDPVQLMWISSHVDIQPPRPIDELFRENMRRLQMQDAQNEVLDALNQRYALGIVSAPAVRAYISRAYDNAFEWQDELYKNDAARLYEGMEMLAHGALQEIQNDLDAGGSRFRETGDSFALRYAGLTMPPHGNGNGAAPFSSMLPGPNAFLARGNGQDIAFASGFYGGPASRMPYDVGNSRSYWGRQPASWSQRPYARHGRQDGRAAAGPFHQRARLRQPGSINGSRRGLLAVTANGPAGHPSARGGWGTS